MVKKKASAAARSKTVSRQTLAHNLRASRVMCGWSQEQLGLKCNLRRSYIGALERGEINPGIDNLDRIAGGIGIPTHVLLLKPDEAYPLMFRALQDRRRKRRWNDPLPDGPDRRGSEDDAPRR